jgi:hypothetical protein
VLTVFETLNARPPGALATLGLLAVHGGSFFLSLVLLVVFIAGRMGWFHRGGADVADAPLPYEYTVGTAREWRGAAAAAVPPAASFTLAAIYEDENAARAEFAALPAELPDRATLQLFGKSLLLTLPENQEAQRARWADRLLARARSVVGKKPKSQVMLSLSTVLSSEAEAQLLGQELHTFVMFPEQHVLLAPWSAEWKRLPAAERERFQKARQTKGRLDQLREQAMQQPNVQALQKDLRRGFFGKNPAATDKAVKDYQQAIQAEEDRLFAELAAEEEAAVDHAIVKLYERSRENRKKFLLGPNGQEPNPEDFEALNREFSALQAEMAKHMGAVALNGLEARLGRGAEAGLWGRVTRQGSTVSIRGLFLPHIRHELAALADWLGQREGRLVRYDLREMSADSEEEDDEPGM